MDTKSFFIEKIDKETGLCITAGIAGLCPWFDPLLPGVKVTIIWRTGIPISSISESFAKKLGLHPAQKSFTNKDESSVLENMRQTLMVVHEDIKKHFSVDLLISDDNPLPGTDAIVLGMDFIGRGEFKINPGAGDEVSFGWKFMPDNF